MWPWLVKPLEVLFAKKDFKNSIGFIQSAINYININLRDEITKPLTSTVVWYWYVIAPKQKILNVITYSFLTSGYSLLVKDTFVGYVRVGSGQTNCESLNNLEKCDCVITAPRCTMEWFISPTGSVQTTILLPLVYIQCYPCQMSNHVVLSEFLYYLVLAAAHQPGWAIVQVSHLALIPEISDDEAEKLELNSLRLVRLI